jgi:hypothetical protein
MNCPKPREIDMVYLIQLDKPLVAEGHKAQFYLGYCDEDRLLQRLAEHWARRGSKMLAAAVQKGIHFDIVRFWPGGTRKLERQYKRRKCHRRLLTAPLTRVGR